MQKTMTDASAGRGSEFNTAEATLNQLERLFEEFAGGLSIPRDALARARSRAARIVLDPSAPDARATGIAALAFAADMFAALAVDLASHRTQLSDLIDQIEDVSGVPRAALGYEVLSAQQLLQLPTAVAVEVQLSLLLAFAHQRAVSVWALWPGGDLRHVADAGESELAAPSARRLARSLLIGDPAPPRPRSGSVTGIVVEGRQQHRAALVAIGPRGSQIDPKPMLEAAAAMLSAILERDELLGRSTRQEVDAAASTERRLTRLRFDLHDGPQQDVILLGDDLRLFRSQLEPVLEDHPHKTRVLGRLDDLQALLVAIDGDLRRIAAFVQSPFLQPEPLPDALATLTDEFAARTGIDPVTQLGGDFSKLSDSQQITLLGLIREALSNIREHSDAQHVTISLSSDKRGVKVTVTDDGRGFDPETTLIRAAREGHLGLVGMYERVRMLEGRTQIESRPGGPTVVSVSLPPMPMPMPMPVPVPPVGPDGTKPHAEFAGASVQLVAPKPFSSA